MDESQKQALKSGKYWHNGRLSGNHEKNVRSQNEWEPFFLRPSCRKSTFSHIPCFSFQFIKVSRILKNGQI